MPTGYIGRGGTYSKRTGKWSAKKIETSYDYENIKNPDGAALLLSLFRWFPDFYYDVIRSPNAKYKLELPQRVMLRIMARYRVVYVSGSRGLTKTFCVLLSKEHEGAVFPGEVVRYCAPRANQSALLASNAFKETLRDYPIHSMIWNKNNDQTGLFKISTDFGSQFTMYAPRGDNSSAIVGEEMGQEGDNGFDFTTFEKDIHPTCRLGRKIHGIDDRTHINLKETYIANACSRQNKAFTTYRANAIKAMISDDKYAGYAIDIPWECSLLCNIRDIEYFKAQKAALSTENWLREMCVRYIGAEENPLIPDEVINQSRQLLVPELEHCGDKDAIYIVSHDVSYIDSRKNAKCADVVVKLTRYDTVNKRDKYRKQVVFVDNYPPLATDYAQADKLKQLWYRYCMDGGQTTYLVVDTQAYGKAVVEELMKPSSDGTPTLCCVDHDYIEIEQKGALPVIYPLKAESRGTKNNEGMMIQYAQNEFEKGYVELLTSNVYAGIEAYKARHNIKDIYYDGKIRAPYANTELLCQQIGNLKTEVSGTTLKERRFSKGIQRDIWSALKYALRFAEILEKALAAQTYKRKSGWAALIDGYATETIQNKVVQNNERSRLLGLRRGR